MGSSTGLNLKREEEKWVVPPQLLTGLSLNSKCSNNQQTGDKNTGIKN